MQKLALVCIVYHTRPSLLPGTNTAGKVSVVYAPGGKEGLPC